MAIDFTTINKVMCKSIVIFLLLSTQVSVAQLLFPAKWNIEVSQKDINVGDEVDLIFNVKLDSTWYLYSTDFDPNLGPIITTFSFDEHPSYQLIDEIQPVGSKRRYDETWDGEYTYFKGKAKFIQRIKILAISPTIEGEYAYQVCSEIDGKCILFDDYFDFGVLLSN